MHGLIFATPKIPSSHPCILPYHPDGNLANLTLITTRASVIIYSENQWNEMKQNIRDGILRKINAVRLMQTINKDIAGGLYVYAIEEFGKLLLFRNVPSLNGRRKEKYDGEFVKHEKKIEAAFNYFRMNNFHPCLISARACGQTSDVEDVEWRDVVVDLPADTEARL